MKPSVVILGAPGTNRNADLAFAFEQAGAQPTYLNVTELPDRGVEITAAQIVAIAGGFSYADALGSARVFAAELLHRTGELLHDRVAAGIPVIGICNGFQMLVRAGLLPGAEGMRATLAHNGNGKFECRWVSLRAESRRCIWTSTIEDIITCPVAHGEGRFVTDAETLSRIETNDMVALRYTDPVGNPMSGAYPENPNGSLNDIAGICDATGLVLGMMPHPENHVVSRQGRSGSTTGAQGLALKIFTNGVHHVLNA